MSDIQQELLAAWDAEYHEHLAVVRAGLDAARRGQMPDLKDIFRRIHSLKGAARAVDISQNLRLEISSERSPAKPTREGCVMTASS